MSENILNARLRDISGKGGARQLRASGMIPGVYYGHHEANIHFAVGEVELGRLLKKRHTILDLKIENDDVRQCVIRSIQRDPVDSKFIHIDLLAVHKGEKITIAVPVKLTGLAIGVKESGGVLEHGLSELTIECDPVSIPEILEVDVTALGLGHSIHVKDLSFPDIKIIEEESAMVAHVGTQKAERAPVAEEPAAGESAAVAASESKE